MQKLVFDAYEVQSPFFEQKSNVAFMMLQSAVLKTQERPEQPKRMSEWLSMVKLMEGFAALEHVLEEVVQTPEGAQRVSITVLKPEGGEIDLDADSFNLLETLWEGHVEKNLNYSHARQVVITREFLKNAAR